MAIRQLVQKKTPLRGNQINWNQIFYFSEVATYGSIKEAASRLDLSPSTLSEHISELEKDLHVQLFHRMHRKLELTPEGARLFQHAKQMFETGQRLVDVVSPVPLGCYPVAIGMVSGSSAPIGYRIVEQYLSRHPEVSIRCQHSSHDDLERGLAEAKFDFGFSDRLPERKDVASHLVANSSIQFYVATRHAGRPFSELLQKLPLLICNAETGTRTPMERLLEQLELTPKSLVISDFPSMILELCESGRGISVFADQGVREPFRERFHALRLPKGAPKLEEKLYALWARGAENTEAVRHLKEILPS